MCLVLIESIDLQISRMQISKREPTTPRFCSPREIPHKLTLTANNSELCTWSRNIAIIPPIRELLCSNFFATETGRCCCSQTLNIKDSTPITFKDGHRTGLILQNDYSAPYLHNMISFSSRRLRLAGWGRNELVLTYN